MGHLPDQQRFFPSAVSDNSMSIYLQYVCTRSMCIWWPISYHPHTIPDIQAIITIIDEGEMPFVAHVPTSTYVFFVAVSLWCMVTIHKNLKSHYAMHLALIPPSSCHQVADGSTTLELPTEGSAWIGEGPALFGRLRRLFITLQGTHHIYPLPKKPALLSRCFSEGIPWTVGYGGTVPWMEG